MGLPLFAIRKSPDMEKKLVSVGLRIEESLLLKAKALAEHSGITESAFIRMAISQLIEQKREEYVRLHSIFGDELLEVHGIGVEQGSTGSMAEPAGHE